MADQISLGGFVFRDFEIPEELIIGGAQKIIEHNLIGGQRILESMGPVPAPIVWQGRFRGPDAMARAQTLDAMRQAGAQLPLIWGGVYRSVVICQFVARIQRANEVPYQIELKVADDPTFAGAGFGAALGSTLDVLITGDLSALGSALGGVIGSLGF